MAKAPSTTRKRKRASSAPPTDAEHDSSQVSPTTAIDISSSLPPFLKLPNELIGQILSEVFAKDPDPSNSKTTVTLRSPKSRRWRNEVASLGCAWDPNRRLYMRLYNQVSPPPRITRALTLDSLLVCRRFYFAGVDAFYGENVLAFETAISFAGSLQRTNADRRRCVKNVVVNVSWNDEKMILDPWIMKLPGLDCGGDEPAFKKQDLLMRLPNLKSITVRSRIHKRQLVRLRLNKTQFDESVSARVKEAWASVSNKLSTTLTVLY